MKKAFRVFSLCLVLVLAGLTAAAVTLHDSRDDVEVTLTTLAGDPVQAQGLVATQQAQQSAQLVWDLTIPLDDPARAETNFTYHLQDLDWTPYQEDALNIYTAEASTHYIEGTYTAPTAKLLAEDPAFLQLLPLLEEVAAQTQPGKSFSKTIHPKDYLDCYPVTVYSNVPRAALRYDETTTDYYDQQNLIPQFFQENFPLPIAEEETWTITVKRRTTGYIEEVRYDSSGPTSQVSTLTAYHDQALYFAFSQDNWPQPDYDKFPLGNGVYRMDIVQEKDLNFVEVQTLTNVFPLPNEAMVLDLTLDGEENLLVTWYLDGDYTCTILDGETMEPTDTIPLFHRERKEAEVIVCDNYSAEEYTYQTWVYDQVQALAREDFILFLGETQFWLFVETQEGWQQQCTAPLGESLLWVNSAQWLDAAWNGEKLAIGFCTDSWSSGLTLLVYDSAGDLLFNGTYDTSLTYVPETEGYTHGSNVMLMDGKAVALTWN